MPTKQQLEKENAKDLLLIEKLQEESIGLDEERAEYQSKTVKYKARIEEALELATKRQESLKSGILKKWDPWFLKKWSPWFLIEFIEILEGKS